MKKMERELLPEELDREECVDNLKLLSGSEPFTQNGESIGLSVVDFWSFQFSNILHDPDEIAEFLVAKALGQTRPYNKNSWTLFDILYRNKRIEVKQTAYYHPFNEPGKLSSVRRFGIQKVKGDDGKLKRQNDVYVFCLLNGENEKSAWPLEVSHWEFYVISTLKINDTFGDQKTVSLSRVKELVSPVPYAVLKDAIDDVVNSSIHNGD